MGNRITRAARHLPTDAVQERIRSEKRPWRRQRWEIIYQALTAPRHAEDIARTVGVSLSTVHRVIALYKQGGVAAIETPGKGGRRHHYLTLEQERAFLQPFLARAARGEMATAVEIKLALEARIGARQSTKVPCIACWTGMDGSRLVLRPVLLRPRRASSLKETWVRCGRRAGPLKETLLRCGSAGSSRLLSTPRGSCHPSATPVTFPTRSGPSWSRSSRLLSQGDVLEASTCVQ